LEINSMPCRFRWRAPCLALILISLSACSRAPDNPADLIIVNARVFGPGTTRAEAVAIRDHRIVLVGARTEVEALAGSATQRLDAHGASVTPGFNDAHVHLLSGGLSLGRIELLDAQTLLDIEKKIEAFATANPRTPWVLGRGWVYGAFPGGLPTKQQLDRLVPDRPAAIRAYDGHTVWVNSRALALAGITRATPDPADGEIVRDPASREPTGVLKEGAQGLVNAVIPTPTRDEKLAALKAALRVALASGVTSMQEAGADEEMLELLETLRASGELEPRIYLALDGLPKMTERDVDAFDTLKARFPKLDIGAVKLFADGVIEAHTAAMLEPYSNQQTRGMPEFTAEDLNRVVAILDRRGWQVMIHAIGDAGIRMSLDAFEQAARANPVPARGRRHRLEHVEDVSAADISRFASLDVIASMQPFHASPNGNVLEVWAGNIGPERASRAWNWKSIRDAGGRLAFGTDFPVVGIDPRPGLHTALTRQTPQGLPPEGFVPEQRLPLDVALRAYTEGSAYAQFADESKGTIAAGQLADLVVWDRDLFASPVDKVKDASVVTTILDGKVVYPASR
jgi:predicted amidohydrolase YtcJ